MNILLQGASVWRRKPLSVAAILALSTLLVIGVRSAVSTESGLLFTDTFNRGSFRPYDGGAGWNQTQFTRRSRGRIVASPTRSGAGAARFNLRYPNKRAEKNKFIAGKPGTERWFGFSIYIPRTWRDHKNFTIVAQLKGSPDQGEPYRSPFLPLEIRNGVWTLFNRWDPTPISRPRADGNRGTIRSAKIYEAPYTKGKWTDWVIHAKWSYQQDGLLEIWKDGVKVVHKTGPNCYNDVDHGFHFKIGMYKPGYRANHPSPLVVYHDEVRIGNRHASYARVAPGRN
ncbi:MAG: hypothetical protein F6K19_36295 [Cyanothece sp. SIO1E1]|nr:hypothetical protein [Cyanothece sp. SIO1E1]